MMAGTVTLSNQGMVHCYVSRSQVRAREQPANDPGHVDKITGGPIASIFRCLVPELIERPGSRC